MSRKGGKLRFTSVKIYDSKWKGFAHWCASQVPTIDPWEAFIQQIAEFLHKLFDDGLQIRTIADYRTTIASSLDMKGRNIGVDVVFSRLLKSVFVDRPVRRNVFPQWDLSIVLTGLRLHPFERTVMADVPLNLLAYNAVFFLALLSGARRGAIHALDHDKTCWSYHYTRVYLNPNPFHMENTQTGSA